MKTPPGATRALLLRHIGTQPGGIVELRGRDVAEALGIGVRAVQAALRGLIDDGQLRPLLRGSIHNPSKYQVLAVAQKPTRKRAVPKPAPKPAPKPLNVQIAPPQPRRIPALVTLAPTPRPDNPVRKVPPGTFAARGFSMLGGTMHG